MATNGSALVSADIPVEDTSTFYETTPLVTPDTYGPVVTTGVYSGGGTSIGSSVVDTSIDSTGDEGYVDSSGSLGGGNSVSSNNPAEFLPAAGSPVASHTGIVADLENLTSIASAAAQTAIAIDNRTNTAVRTIGRQGQSAPVRGLVPSLLGQLFGTSSGRVSGVNQASSTGITGLLTLAAIVLVIIGLIWLVSRVL